MLGRVYGAIALYLLRPQLALLGLIAPDYVLHSLDEFRAYKSARIDRKDEPRFALVEHKVFGLGTPLYRKQLDNGLAVVVVQYGDRERTLAVDPAQWVTPIEAILSVKMLKVEEYKFPDKTRVKSDMRGTKTRAVNRPLKQQFSRCSQCGDVFRDEKGCTTKQNTEFCGEISDGMSYRSSGCSRDWLTEHKPDCEMPKREPCLVTREMLAEDGKQAENRKSLRKWTVKRKTLDSFWCWTCGDFCEQFHDCERVQPINYVQLLVEQTKTTMRNWQAVIDRLPTRSKDTVLPDAKPGDLVKWIMLRATALPGRRVSTISFPLLKNDSCSRDYRADKIFSEQRSWEQVLPTRAVCERKACGKEFYDRKGTLHCTPNCRKRDHGERKQHNLQQEGK
jgi:hypothetical protein